MKKKKTENKVSEDDFNDEEYANEMKIKKISRDEIQELGRKLKYEKKHEEMETKC